MDTLTQFLTRSRRYVHELNTSTSFWTETFMTNLFNANYRRRCAQLIMAHEGWFTMIATRDIEEGKSTYGLPTGCQRIIKLELVRTDGSTVPLQRWERHEAPNPTTGSQGTGDGYFPTYRPFSNGFILEPGPLETVTDGVQIEFSGLPAVLAAADSPHPSFPEIFDELLVLDTVCACLDAEGLHEMGPVQSIYTQRDRWEEDYLRFIDSRAIARQRVEPFVNWYEDA